MPASWQAVELWVTIRFRVDPKWRSVDGAEETVPDVQSVVGTNPSVVEGFSDREEDGDLDRAGGVEAPVGIDREAKPRLVIAQRHRVSHGFAFAQDAFAGLSQGFGSVFHDRAGCYLQRR